MSETFIKKISRQTEPAKNLRFNIRCLDVMLVFEINARLTYLHDSTNFIASFECKALKVFKLKYTNHGGIYGCDIISLEKLTKRQNSESCKADFWPVRRLGSSLNFK